MTDRSRSQANNALGDSVASMDTESLSRDGAAARADTHSLSRRPAAPAWGAAGNGSAARNSTEARNRASLHLIMNEQLVEQMTKDEYPIEHGSSSYRQLISRHGYGPSHLQASHASEDEMMRIALERSMADANLQDTLSNQSNHSHQLHQSQGQLHQSQRSLGNTGYHSNSREADIIQRVQADADRTETVIETPHMDLERTTSLRRLNSWDENGPFPDHRSVGSRSIGNRTMNSHSSGDRSLPSRANSVGTPRRGVRRVGSSRSAAASATASIQSPALSRARSCRSVSSSSASLSPHSTASGSRRIGTKPHGAVRGGENASSNENRYLLSGAQAVLEVARENLTPEEVRLIEQALLGTADSEEPPTTTDPRSSPTSHSGTDRRGYARSNAVLPHRRPPLYDESEKGQREDVVHDQRRRVRASSWDHPDDHDLHLPDAASHRVASQSIGDEASGYPNGSPLKSPNPGGNQLLSGRFPERLSPCKEQSSLEQSPRDLQSSSHSTGYLQTYPRNTYADGVGHASFSTPTTLCTADVASVPTFSSGSENEAVDGQVGDLSLEELRLIQQALAESGEELPPDMRQRLSALEFANNGNISASDNGKHHTISDEEAAAIEYALREADREAELMSLQAAMQYQREEEEEMIRYNRSGRRQPQGNVRTVTRAELELERAGAFQPSGPPSFMHSTENAEAYPPLSAGFRMNSTSQQEWIRRDQNSVLGPNDEIRSKHDLELHGLANAHRLGMDDDVMIGNRAYNSFMQSVRSKNKKGVAAHGTGRAGSDADGTVGGAMDPRVRLHIGKAINSGLIDKCNGVVKEGKEAIVFHAEKGPESDGFDVAIKVFKRIVEFRGRGSYVDGDPRYARDAFGKASSREQLELWTEKEFRNLMRAKNAGVPVPVPLQFRENVLFMRFLGEDGWPSPQLRELTLRSGSKTWEVLYSQIMDSVRQLYTKGRLVHGDLSEYNVLVVPNFLQSNTAANSTGDFVPVLIDFGQAVDTKHPDAVGLLQRDIERIRSFFLKKGIEVLDVHEAMAYVTSIDS